ncbi:MAG: glycine--tRNA ligase, partial [Phycisphaerae bacterium]|nr:glycine--tRNA ligase [Phycisphaerae bacterium]
MAEKSMEKLVSLCKRRGFVFPASEIYGGINGFWDYGPLGIQLKNNIRDDWWRNMVECPPVGPDGHPLQIVGLDSAIIQNPKTWEASGHVGGFNDPMVDCKESKSRYRADHLLVISNRNDTGENRMYAFIADDSDSEDRAHKLLAKYEKVDLPLSEVDYQVRPLVQLPVEDLQRIVGPDVKTPGSLTEPRQFNLMLDTYPGVIRDETNKAYLRPETAQGIFLNYKNVLDTMRVRVPFGIAQVGKAFRNEVTPRNFIFRSREFEQMEMEWFCHPDDAKKWYEFWKDQRMKWWLSLGIDPENLICRDHEQDELAHYSSACVDVEYRYPFTTPGFGELEGIAHRGGFDLTQHQEHSKVKMQYFDQERNERYIPHVIEPAGGLTRGTLVLLCEAFTLDENRPSGVYMKFLPRLAPIKAAIFPLVNKEGMPEIAEKLYLDLRGKFTCQFDVKQNIGKRYARMDEVGTPFCFTIDGQTKEDQTVTVRYRDTLQQERIGIDKVEAFL